MLSARYRLMPYLYTAYFQSHTYGSRPLFFGQHSDNIMHATAEQGMVGYGLLVDLPCTKAQPLPVCMHTFLRVPGVTF